MRRYESTDYNGSFVVRRTTIGLSLFAGRRFLKGSKVIEYTGTLLSQEEADRKGGRYLFQVNGRWTIDGTGRENISRYINHSCRPNCVPYTHGRKVLIYARRDIAEGEELTYNYGKEYFDEYIKPKGCACESCVKRRQRRWP
jgi:SET domain-containing protein